MISQGHTRESIDSLPLDVKMDLRRLWDLGLLGWRQQELIGYRQHQMLESLIKVMSGSKNKKLAPYSKYSPSDDLLLPKKVETRSEKAMRLINLAESMSGKKGSVLDALVKSASKS